MKTSTYQKTFVICPNCEAKTDSSVDHLNAGSTAGPWCCDECGVWYSLTIGPNREVSLEINGRSEPRRHGLALLKTRGSDPVFFVFDCKRYRTVDDEEQQSSDAFFYEEHSCPTNWLRNCVAVIENGDTDPHGFLEFVRSIDITKEQKEILDEGQNDHDLFDMFPEIPKYKEPLTYPVDENGSPVESINAS